MGFENNILCQDVVDDPIQQFSESDSQIVVSQIEEFSDVEGFPGRKKKPLTCSEQASKGSQESHFEEPHKP